MIRSAEVVIPLHYSSSRRVLDILIRRRLLAVAYRYGMNSRSIVDRILPRGCSVIALQKPLPLIYGAVPVLIGLDNLTANRLMGTVEYSTWIEGQLRRMIKAGLLPKQARHIFLRPFLKSLRPENPVHESLELIQVFHGLSYPLNWRGSFLDYVNSICLKVLGRKEAWTRTGDLPSPWVERLCIELFRSQPFVMYSFHSKTFSYFRSLNPSLWLAPVSIVKLGLESACMPVFLDRESLLLTEILYPSLQAEEDKGDLRELADIPIDDDEDDEDEQDEIRMSSAMPDKLQSCEFGIATTAAKEAVHLDPPGSLTDLQPSLEDCPSISPDKILGDGKRVNFRIQRLEQELSRVGHTDLKSLLIVFLPQPLRQSSIGLICDDWANDSYAHHLSLRIDVADMKSIETSYPGSMGSGKLYLCGIAADADPTELYALVRKDTKHLPARMIKPLLRLARIEQYRFRP